MRQARAFAASALLAACLAGAGCATRYATDFGYIDDDAITSSLRARMAETPNFDPAGIEVETRDGAVTLSGTASTPVDKAIAQSLASKLKGVRLVRNELAVRG